MSTQPKPDPSEKWPARLERVRRSLSMPDENSTNVALENATLEGGRALRLS